jgi:hypothetical protein
MYKINFHYHLHLGEGLEYKDLMQIKKDLRENPVDANLFIITLSANEQEQLDIYDAKYLIQKYYSKNPPYVVGIAKDKGQAIEVVERLMQECVTNRGDANLRAYIMGE